MECSWRWAEPAKARTWCIVCVISMAYGLAPGSVRQSLCLPFICIRWLLHGMLGLLCTLGVALVPCVCSGVGRWSHLPEPSPNKVASLQVMCCTRRMLRLVYMVNVLFDASARFLNV
jgi:hypothetical protein